MSRQFVHLHMISDSTGETLIAVSRAAAAQYQDVTTIEHVSPLIRSRAQLERAIAGIEASPGLVLFTLVDAELVDRLEQACEEIGCPYLSVLHPVLGLFQSYLGQPFTPKPGAQHVLNAEYFKRIDALNFTMAHDDGQVADGYEKADVLLLGVSRTSKTPTSIYLANRGVKTANIPLVPQVPLDPSVFELKGPLIVGLIASPERIVQIRQNRLLTLNANPETPYVDKMAVSEELAYSRRLFAQNQWPAIDVTRRSIEETAAAIIDLHRIHRLKFIAQA